MFRPNYNIRFNRYEISKTNIFLIYEFYDNEIDLNRFKKIDKYIEIENISNNKIYYRFKYEDWFSDNFKKSIRTKVYPTIKVEYFLKIPIPRLIKKKINKSVLDSFIESVFYTWLNKYGKKNRVLKKFKMLNMVRYHKVPFRMIEFSYNSLSNSIIAGVSTIYSIALYKALTG